MTEITKRDYIACRAMQVVTSETQEMLPKNFWNWLKWLMFNLLHFTWLVVEYKTVEGSNEMIAKRSYELADAMIKESEK